MLFAESEWPAIVGALLVGVFGPGGLALYVLRLMNQEKQRADNAENKIKQTETSVEVYYKLVSQFISDVQKARDELAVRFTEADAERIQARIEIADLKKQIAELQKTRSEVRQ